MPRLKNIDRQEIKKFDSKKYYEKVSFIFIVRCCTDTQLV